MSNISRVTKETVSFEKLEQNLPSSCFQAVLAICNKQSYDVDESIIREYFNHPGTPVLTKEEQEQLFEQLGNAWVKNHYSTETLRTFLEKEPTQKRNRKHE